MSNDPFQNPEVVEVSIDLCRRPECDLRRLGELSRLTKLNIQGITCLEQCVRTIVDRIPGVTDLTLSCDRRENQILPPDIGRLIALEDLAIGYCNIFRFPEEMAGLVRLRSFKTYSVSLNPFPEFLITLPLLEKLQLCAGGMTGLPEALGDMRRLNSLNLSGGFDYDFQGPRTGAARDIVIIASIPKLESLDLGDCGLSTLAGLERLSSLRWLDLSVNYIPDITPLRNLHSLECLLMGHLKSSIAGQGGAMIRDLSPLGGLERLRALDISHWSTWRHDFVIDLTPLAGCKQLREISCSCTEVVGLSALKELGLSKVEFDSEQRLAWLMIQKEPVIPDVECCRKLLRSDNADERRCGVEQVIVLRRVEPNMRLHSDEELLPSLMEALPKLSDAALGALLPTTFRQAGDNSSLAGPVVEEILRRGGVELENVIVETFLAAHADYEAGHRSSGASVQNRFMDEYLPRLSAPVLAALLQKLDFRMLNSLWGDGLESLFAAALLQTTTKADQLALLERLNQHLATLIKVGAIAEAGELVRQVEPQIMPELRSRIQRLPTGTA